MEILPQFQIHLPPHQMATGWFRPHLKSKKQQIKVTAATNTNAKITILRTDDVGENSSNWRPSSRQLMQNPSRFHTK